jgi:hypothetical protein
MQKTVINTCNEYYCDYQSREGVNRKPVHLALLPRGVLKTKDHKC